MTMKEAKDFINSKDNFGIICHKSPDGDTLGSGLALYHGLRQLGKNCQVYCKDKPNSVFGILDGIESLKPIEELNETNLIFCDCADIQRAAFEQDLSNFNILNIDHHISNTRFGDINIIQSDACAACQIMYYFLESLGVVLNTTIAKCLYVGICTDTNNFTNSNINSDTFEVMGKIAKVDFGLNEVVKALFRTKSYGKTKAMARYIDRIQMMFDNKFCASYITLKDIEELALEDTEGLVDIGVDIEGVSVSAFLKETEENSFKASLRSNYNVDVCKICEAFGGGGHVKASGCMINGNLEEVMAALKSEVGKWME